MNSKHCPHCNSNTIIRFGESHGKQRYRCKGCGKTWTNKRRPARLKELIWHDYVVNGYTIDRLSQEYHKSKSTIRDIIAKYSVPDITPSPAEVIMMDVTYFGRKWGILVAINAHTSKTIYAKVINHAERVQDYEDVILALHGANIHPKACVIDGRKGIRKMLEDYGIKVQICQFHTIAFVNACLTRNPVLEPNIELRNVALSLTHVNKDTFSNMIYGWRLRHEVWMQERTYSKNPDTGKLEWEYTHPLSRRAARTLSYNLPYLFTYQDYPELHIPNTTNLLEGKFGYIKRKLLNHNGANKQLKIKIFFSLLSDD